jgi:hypothetical protein
MLVTAMTNASNNKKGKKPPVGVDTHMLGNKVAAAAGVGRRGADSKVMAARRSQTPGFPVWPNHAKAVSCLSGLPDHKTSLKASTFSCFSFSDGAP